MTTQPAPDQIPLPGPLHTEPLEVDHARAVAQLSEATQRLPWGAFDDRIRLWLGGKDASVVATVASWLRRASEQGTAAGRTERVDEAPTVQHLAASLDRSTRAATFCATRLSALLIELEIAATDQADADLRTAITTACRRARRP